ncbi:hypothetical protein SAMN04488023_104135 [Pedobacter rhizosphaerae]|uniref:Uncharacterized protein n=2 Tax=Pedobacter rhizosphaerae TaxID=390241 RepID=A0A1H9LGF4_9SPHI|nr:hypothetical protein SAMN04488023_104135 [Pedobacter rhizosphaerae]
MICLMAVLLFKVGGVAVYLNHFNPESTYLSVQEDATEKEEKKVETEYFDHQFMAFESLNTEVVSLNKPALPTHFFILSYFPEVLTPPPLFG